MENLPEHDELQKELAHLRAECIRLRVENANLKTQAVIAPITQSIHSQAKNAQAILSTEQKIALFQRLFRGRKDVYAIRWQNKQGRSGYIHQPVAMSGIEHFAESQKSNVTNALTANGFPSPMW